MSGVAPAIDKQVYIQEAAQLLVAAVEEKEQEASAGASGRGTSGSLDLMEEMDLVPIEGLKPLQTSLSSKLRSVTEPSTVWGWLEPGSRVLPFVVLKGTGVVIGRGREVFEARLRALETMSPAMNAGNVPQGMSKRMSEAMANHMAFVEVADGRVSRLHCLVSQQLAHGEKVPILEDCSSNGTFVNGKKVGRGKSIPLKDGDRMSLVLSVAPLVEQYFMYHEGNPQDTDISKGQWVGGEAVGSSSPLTPPRGRPQPSQALSRSTTSRYTTAEQSTLDDFQCQICLGTLRCCVAIEPCGHNFCACCLSQYFGTQLENGVPHMCPLRCPDPERVVLNDTVRNLVDNLERSLRLKKGTREASKEDLAGQEAEASGRASGLAAADEADNTMSVLCPLNDDDLPVDAVSLKSRQVDVTLRRLGSPSTSVDDQLVCLEVLARLAWSDDSVREEVANTGGIDLIIKIMRQKPNNEGIQCNCCLALMSLVRGEGEVCQANQWNLAKAGAVEAMADAMRLFRDHPMVQLSALLCFIPLSLENSMMQAHLCQLVLSDVLLALDNHLTEADIQCKGLVVLGVMAQGDDAMHDSIRQRLLEANAHSRVSKSLKAFGSDNDEVLWAGLFALATLARDGSTMFKTACRALAQSRLLTVLKSVLEAYTKSIQDEGIEEDETIVTAGEYLVSVISEARDQLMKEWQQVILGGVMCCVASSAVIGWYLFRRRR
ncbi:unnamed protein product [Ostreobium quekettii]|uniref:E3 ubiquitin-protein ligase CHFR n=1 Tax=Ostreobium quekettii TaxID=121088 RepID=A0A8S1JA74_9CHLO|nr:unnamed protein product [Ostreobium quekettii]